MKKKVVVFGDLPIATKITKDLISRNNVNLIGVVLSKKKFNNNDPWKNTQCLSEFAKSTYGSAFSCASLTPRSN